MYSDLKRKIAIQPAPYYDPSYKFTISSIKTVSVNMRMQSARDQSGGRPPVILPRRWQLLGPLVISRNAVDPRLDQNESVLCILILPVRPHVLPNGDGSLNQKV